MVGGYIGLLYMFTSELTTSIDAMEETALKFVLVGDSNVGKSQLSLRFCKDKFYPDSHSTVGIEFATRTLQMHDNAIKAQLWDTAGQVCCYGILPVCAT